MNIVVDLASTNGGKKQTGLGMYASQLFAALKTAAPQHHWIGLQEVTKDLSTPKRVWWDQVRLPRAAKREKADILFVPAFSSPIRYHGKKVMTVHDLNGILLPEIFSRLSRWYWGSLLPRSAKSCDAVIVPSEVTANDVRKYLRLPDNKIHVIGEGVHPDIHLLDNAAILVAGLKEMNLHHPFILSVGTQEPRKNYPKLIEAFARSKRGEHELVIVGKASWGSADIHKMIEKFHLQNKVRLLDYVSTQQLTILYNACTAFVLVSQYEGFGLPALEAMRCGAPVIVADRGSLPEIVDAAGMLVNPNDITDIEEKINRIIADELLRIKFQHASVQRSQAFSWAEAARKTLQVLERV